MDIEAVKKRFIEEIKLRAYEDRYVDREEEKEILKIAIQEGIGVDSARLALQHVCAYSEYILETSLDQKAKELLEQFVKNDGQVDKKEFNDAVSMIHSAAKGRLSQVMCQKKIKQIMTTNSWGAREGFLKGGRWFSEI
ncbi:conserved hypothetical protein [Gammaproteobacteria bacterium]